VSETRIGPKDARTRLDCSDILLRAWVLTDEVCDQTLGLPFGFLLCDDGASDPLQVSSLARFDDALTVEVNNRHVSATDNEGFAHHQSQASRPTRDNPDPTLEREGG